MAAALALDHIVIVAADIEVTLAWYQRHLGLSGVRVDEWRRGEAPFPSLRVEERTIIDVVAGDPGTARGHLDHICFAVDADHLAAVKADGALQIEDEGVRFGAQGYGESIYVRDPDGLTVEIRTYSG